MRRRLYNSEKIIIPTPADGKFQTAVIYGGKINVSYDYGVTWKERGTSLTELLDLLSQLQGKFMLTMFPNDHIKAYSDRYNWNIHVYERTISACPTNRRKQEEWIICNY